MLKILLILLVYGSRKIGLFKLKFYVALYSLQLCVYVFQDKICFWDITEFFASK